MFSKIALSLGDVLGLDDAVAQLNCDFLVLLVLLYCLEKVGIWLEVRPNLPSGQINQVQFLKFQLTLESLCLLLLLGISRAAAEVSNVRALDRAELSFSLIGKHLDSDLLALQTGERQLQILMLALSS